MSIDTNVLAKALSTFVKHDKNFDGEDEEGYMWRGRFLNTRIRIGDKTVREGASLNDKLHLLYSSFANIQEDVSDIAAIALRTNWLKGMLTQREIKEGIWRIYAAADIDLYHVVFRSIFDYLAYTITLVSNKPGQISSESFRSLRHWLNKDPANIKKLGEDLADIVRSCDWFDDIRFVRDSIVHYGARTSTHFEDERVLFRVDLRLRSVNLASEIMHNSELADFERYAGLYTGYLLSYLEEVAAVIHKRLALDVFNTEMRFAHPGFIILRSWVESVYNVSTAAIPHTSSSV